MSEQSPRKPPAVGWKLLPALKEAGVIGERVQRVVIDITHDNYVHIYTQQVPNEDLLTIVQPLADMDVRVTEVKS